MTVETARTDLPPVPPVHESPKPDTDAETVAAGAMSWPIWTPDAVLVAVTVAGLALFVVSLRGIDLAGMNGLGLVSVLPLGAIAGVTVIALGFVVGLFLRRLPVAGLAALLVGLVVCLDGVTIFAEPEPRFATAYQIAGFVNYIGQTGHTAPGLAAYFSWPGFFALIAFVTHAAGIHSLLGLMRIWPVAIDLACLPVLFLLMRRLYVSRRAQWLAAFFFSIGNWVGQDYFSPQSFNYLLYLIFVAILVNWFTGRVRRTPKVRVRTHRLPWPQPSERAAAARRTLCPARHDRSAMVPLRRLGRHLRGLDREPPAHAVLPARSLCCFRLDSALHVAGPAGSPRGDLRGVRQLRHRGLLVGPYLECLRRDWRPRFERLVECGQPVTRQHTDPRRRAARQGGLRRSHRRVWQFSGMARRRIRGRDDRVLIALFLVPVALVGVFSYGGEIALRTYLFLLPPASIFAALLFFPRTHSVRSSQSLRGSWRSFVVLAGCAVVLPAAFFLARYGNEAFEQVPSGELAATNWIYAHDPHGGRVLWLSTDPAVDVTPEMPWSYQDIARVGYLPDPCSPRPG